MAAAAAAAAAAAVVVVVVVLMAAAAVVGLVWPRHRLRALQRWSAAFKIFLGMVSVAAVVLADAAVVAVGGQAVILLRAVVAEAAVSVGPAEPVSVSVLMLMLVLVLVPVG